MSTSDRKVCAFFGATGGCANAALVLALNGGHQVTALARTPSKLTDMLKTAGVPESTIKSNLHVVSGDARDVTAIKAVLSHNPMDIIISGLGMDAMAKSPDATLCQDATKTILAALEDLKPAKKPFLGIISTTGISEGARDVPALMLSMYHGLLRVPHADKKVMEQMVEYEAKKVDSTISGWTAVRPAFLIDRAEAKGFDRMEVGSEEQPAVGYTIPRKDVGLWIFEELIKEDAMDWNGKKPTLVAH